MVAEERCDGAEGNRQDGVVMVLFKAVLLLPG